MHRIGALDAQGFSAVMMRVPKFSRAFPDIRTPRFTDRPFGVGVLPSAKGVPRVMLDLVAAFIALTTLLTYVNY
ncbi:hypothetical protein, partial [Pseudomonas aeruginosa]|uniref:hypothetical protein n=1 Tax=Pseudomonas aeruginosa TaxID=287 RepID=UPI001ABC2CA1